MKKAQLSGSLRTNVGKKDATAIRNAERVPCVLYGQGEQIHFSVRSIDASKLIFSPDVYLVELDIDGTKKQAIIQDLQMHPVKDTPQHIDFLEVVENKPVKISLPIRVQGSSIGVMNGGKLRQPLRMLKVSALAVDLPEAITLDITKLRIGKSVRIGDLNFPGLTFLEPANLVVVAVKMARGAVKTAEEDEEEVEAKA